ncbi:MAG: HIT family protein [Pseudomonadota bacterium]|nr:HIT family protein [Pseudomonadota bacterium]
MASSPPNAPIFNATMRKFGAPQTIIHQYQYWSVMLRPVQLTLGSLVLAAHESAHEFSKLSQASFTELHKITVQLEPALAKAFNYDKLNYLMLMMVDPDVHFHIIPRYAKARYFNGQEFSDFGWPGAPNLHRPNETNAKTNRHIIDYILPCWT